MMRRLDICIYIQMYVTNNKMVPSCFNARYITKFLNMQNHSVVSQVIRV